jgi:hypothetical protein
LDPPPPHPQACFAPPLVPREGDTLGAGGSNSDEGTDTLVLQYDYSALIKTKRKFSSYIRKGNSECSSCKVIYEEGLPNI